MGKYYNQNYLSSIKAKTKSKVDIQLRVDQITNVFKRLQDARVQAVEKFLGNEKTLNDVQAWSNQATERMRRATEYRQQTEEKLESVISEERNSLTETNRYTNRSTTKD